MKKRFGKTKIFKIFFLTITGVLILLILIAPTKSKTSEGPDIKKDKYLEKPKIIIQMFPVWIKNFWNTYIVSILPRLGKPIEKEVKKRTPLLRDEFQKETEELEKEIKIEAPKIKKNILEKFREWFK